ncbi:MAG: 4'-phosphopantetheinyl transferase superfamily protein [Candidatus Babeliaceae bacterium]|jgi:phosphopantetheine--protein transferase-like protein
MASIGLDLVEIERFSLWHLKTNTQLLRIFSQQEINYCLLVPCKSAERFAARFAVKEAFYKAVTPLIIHKKPFLVFCKNTEFVQCLQVNWQALELPEYSTTASITHSRTTAAAVVIIEI